MERVSLVLKKDTFETRIEPCVSWLGIDIKRVGNEHAIRELVAPFRKEFAVVVELETS